MYANKIIARTYNSTFVNLHFSMWKKADF